MNSLFYDMVTRHRDRDQVAFSRDEEGEITYSSLYEKSDAIGRWLNNLFGFHNIPVLICQEKSVNAVVSIFACVKAGFAFIPIDPDFPEERIEFIASASRLKVALVDKRRPEHEALYEKLNICVLEINWKAEVGVSDIRGPRPNPVDLANISDNKISHIIFTSGTTGSPKGVLIKEESQEVFTQTMADAFDANTDTRWLSVSPFYFDVFTLDLFVQAYCGSTVFLVSPNIMPHQLAMTIERKKITKLLLISSIIKMLASRYSGVDQRDFSALETLWYGGEACPVGSLRTLKQYFPHLEFAQGYGPSEVCNNSTLYKFNEVPADIEGYMPLGKTLSSVKGYVVDEKGELITRDGIGELYLGGIQVMDGYINDADLTSKVLVDNRFDENDSYKLYKTGDFIRVDSEGLLHFYGRKDDLVKVRGNRVSLHEVQSVLVSLSGVLDANVFVRRSDEGLDTLVAVVVGEDELEQNVIKASMASKLPAHYLPDEYRLVEKSKVPIKGNGKVDRAALLALYV